VYDMYKKNNKNKAVLKLLLGISFVLQSGLLFAIQLIEPDHKYVQYTGRVDFINPKQPLISWPGTSIKAKFTGNALKIKLDDQEGNNYFNVIIDGNDQFPHVLQANPGSYTYPIAYSITSGMGNEAADNHGDKDLSEKNNYLSYGSITARNLHAEHHTVSLSGIGIMVSWFDFTMKEYFDQINAAGNNNSHWDFSSWTPDIVVINLFQNDSWLVTESKRISPIPTADKITQAYVDFINTIRLHYPNKPIVCALGSMDITQKGSKWPGYVKTAVARIKKMDSKANIDTIFFEHTGYKKHPRVHQHQRNADKLTELIKAKMQW
jgi:hypothetical protein